MYILKYIFTICTSTHLYRQRVAKYASIPDIERARESLSCGEMLPWHVMQYYVPHGQEVKTGRTCWHGKIFSLKTLNIAKFIGYEYRSTLLIFFIPFIFFVSFLQVKLRSYRFFYRILKCMYNYLCIYFCAFSFTLKVR